MHYIDGTVLAVPKENKAIYIKHALEAANIFKEHGAIGLVDPRLAPDVNPFPFDGERMIHGGFNVIVDE